MSEASHHTTIGGVTPRTLVAMKSAESRHAADALRARLMLAVRRTAIKPELEVRGRRWCV